MAWTIEMNMAEMKVTQNTEIIEVRDLQYIIPCENKIS